MLRHKLLELRRCGCTVFRQQPRRQKAEHGGQRTFLFLETPLFGGSSFQAATNLSELNSCVPVLASGELHVFARDVGWAVGVGVGDIRCCVAAEEQDFVVGVCDTGGGGDVAEGQSDAPGVGCVLV